MNFKKLAIIGFASLGLSGIATSVQAQATGVTVPANPDTKDHIFTAGTAFVVTDFTFSLSSSVAMQYIEDPVAIAVSTASEKGRNVFNGSSNGGSVSSCGDPTIGAATPKPVLPSLDPLDTGGCTTI